MAKKSTPPIGLPLFVIDAGNAFVKWTTGDMEGLFVHKVAMLTPDEYEEGLKRYGKTAALDFVEIDGNSYAVGTTADIANVQHRTGAPKYQRDYYGVLLANAIARAFIHNPDALSNGIRVMASHASRDYEYRDELINSIKGRWQFQCGGRAFAFNVKEVETYEEPFGGYARAAFQKDKRGQWVAPLYGLSVGIIDIGGGTCGTLAVNEDGIVQYGMAHSGGQGINSAVARLKSLLKKDYQQFFQKGADIPEDRLRAALAQGVYVGGGKRIPCEQQAELALNPLLNEVKTMYGDKLGGGLAIDVLVLTGGGNAILWEKVRDLTEHGNVILAEPHSDQLQFSNVRGAYTFRRVLEEAM